MLEAVRFQVNPMTAGVCLGATLLGLAACANPAPPPAVSEDVHLEGPHTPATEPAVLPDPAAPPNPTVAVPTTSSQPTSEVAPLTPSAPTFTPLPGSNPGAALDGDRILPSENILFQTGKPTLSAQSIEALKEVKILLDNKPAFTLVRVEVHSDSMGNSAANQSLTEKRALEIARTLVGLGVSCKRLIPVGFGETKPLAENTTPEGRSKNRRTEFVVAALRGRLIDGRPPDGGGVVAGDPCA